MAAEATPEALSIVLEALALLVSVSSNALSDSRESEYAIRLICCLQSQIDPEFTAMAEAKVTPLAIGVFLKHSNDNVLVLLAQDIFRELSKVPACSAPLQQKLLPTLIEILTTPHTKMPPAMPAVITNII